MPNSNASAAAMPKFSENDSQQIYPLKVNIADFLRHQHDQAKKLYHRFQLL
jgi:hypothetical protein